MDNWHRNVRLMHQIDEFLDLDSSQTHSVTDSIALIDAVLEGLTQIDENLRIPDSQINLLFLTKLKLRPEWKDWALMMLRDSRINSSDLTKCLTFQELAKLAIKHEKTTRQHSGKKEKDLLEKKSSSSALVEQTTPRALTQDEINAFVVQQMNKDQKSRHRSRSPIRGHAKRPSQEEINEFVIKQMRQEQEQGTRTRSYSQPEPRMHSQHRSRPTMRCTFCGDTYHQASNCWRRWRVAVEALQGDNIPKQVGSRSGVPTQPRIYMSGFTPF